jgi:hypothetical protein
MPDFRVSNRPLPGRCPPDRQSGRETGTMRRPPLAPNRGDHNFQYQPRRFRAALS